MTAQTNFVAGPVYVDGHALNFFVDMTSPRAAEEVLAAAYTAVFIRENLDTLLFEAYAERHMRLSEDDWYDIARRRYDLHLEAMRQEPDTLRSMREVVEKIYFGEKVPNDVYGLLTQAAVTAYQGAGHAA